MKIKFALLVCAIAILQGCASLPSTEVMRAETANYQLPKLPAPEMALVYVVRPSNLGGLVRFNVFVNSKSDEAEVGYTRGGQYIYFGVPSGTHQIYSNAENWAEMTINAKSGEIIFLQQEPTFGIIMARNNIFRVEEQQGKYYVKTLSVGELIKPEGIQTAVRKNIQPVVINSPVDSLPNPAEKLEQLDALRKKGLITQKDYDTKKAEILKSM